MRVINIMGLAIALAAALFIGLLIRDELGYDRFLPNYDRIARVSTVMHPPGQGAKVMERTRPDVAGWLRVDFSSIEAVARLTSAQQKSFRRGEIEAVEKVYWADPDFLRVVPLPAVAGNLQTALDRPDAVVLTRSGARKYFGRDDPIGERIEMDRRFTMQVAAVIEDLPTNTHFDIEVLASGRAAFSPFARMDANTSDVKAIDVYTYLRLKPGASLAALQGAMPGMVRRHYPNQGRESQIEMRLLPIADIHLHLGGRSNMKATGSPALLAALATIGALIVLTAAINYVNLMTARAARRAIEIGVRKTFGAHRGQLIARFMGESMLSVAFAAMLALIAVAVFHAPFNALMDTHVSATFWHDPVTILAYAGSTLIVGALAAVYPAFVLSAFRPSVVLGGGPVRGHGSQTVRQVLIVSQLAVLMALMIGTLVIYRQGRFAAHEALALNNDLVLLIDTRIDQPCKAALRDEIRALPGVRAAACSLMAPFANGISDGVELPGGEQKMLFEAPVDFDFFEVYGIRPVAGRVFERARAEADSAPTDARKAEREAPLVLNETAVRHLGFASNAAAVGQHISWGRLLTIEGPFGPHLPAEIVGVVADFPMNSIREPVEPTAYYVDPRMSNIVHVKLTGHDVAGTLEQIDALWKQLGDPRPISRAFADDRIQERYLALTRQMQAFAAFAVIALFISCLGLFGLSAFATQRRTREIGIRKALGAGRVDIARYFLWQFTKPVIWAALIALPIAEILTQRWLQGFAYHVSVDARTLLGAVIVTWFIACVTMLAHVLRSALAHPVDALRHP